MIEKVNAYRLNSREEPSDEILNYVMEEVAQEARRSTRGAQKELDRRFQELENSVKAWREQEKLKNK